MVKSERELARLPSGAVIIVQKLSSTKEAYEYLMNNLKIRELMRTYPKEQWSASIDIITNEVKVTKK